MSSTKYWCHICKKEINPSSGTLRCPTCNSDFIEALEEQEQSNYAPLPTNPIGVQRTSPLAPQQSNSQLPEHVVNVINQVALAYQQHQQRQTIAQHPFFRLFQPQQAPVGASLPQTAFRVGGGHPVSFSFQGGTANPFLANLLQVLGLPSNLGDYASDRSFDELLNRLFQASGQKGNPPASQNFLDNLPSFIADQAFLDKKSDCAICQDSFELGSKVIKLPCEHLFHNDCVVKWLKMNNQCPVCRYEMPTDDPEYEERRKRKRTGENNPNPGNTDQEM